MWEEKYRKIRRVKKGRKKEKLDTLGTNNILVQEVERVPRRRGRIRDKGGRPDSAVPGLPGNVVLFLGEFMTTFFPNPLRELFRRLWHTGRRGREGRDRQLQQDEQRVAG